MVAAVAESSLSLFFVLGGIRCELLEEGGIVLFECFDSVEVVGRNPGQPQAVRIYTASARAGSKAKIKQGRVWTADAE